MARAEQIRAPHRAYEIQTAAGDVDFDEGVAAVNQADSSVMAREGSDVTGDGSSGVGRAP